MAGEYITHEPPVYDTGGNSFPRVHVGATNSKKDRGIGVSASLSADTTVQLRFRVPGSLPTGTATLKLTALANATSGVAKVNAKWASVAAEETPDIATGSLNAEGTSTLTWSTGDNDQYKDLDITLDADTVVAGEMIVMELVFETASWTLAAVST